MVLEKNKWMGIVACWMNWYVRTCRAYQDVRVCVCVCVCVCGDCIHVCALWQKKFDTNRMRTLVRLLNDSSNVMSNTNPPSALYIDSTPALHASSSRIKKRGSLTTRRTTRVTASLRSRRSDMPRPIRNSEHDGVLWTSHRWHDTILQHMEEVQHTKRIVHILNVRCSTWMSFNAVSEFLVWPYSPSRRCYRRGDNHVP